MYILISTFFPSRKIITLKWDNHMGAIAISHICANIQVTRACHFELWCEHSNIMQSNQTTDHLGN